MNLLSWCWKTLMISWKGKKLWFQKCKYLWPVFPFSETTRSFFATFFGALVSIPFLVASEISYPSLISLETVLPILYLGLFPTAIAFQLRYHITKTSGPVFLSYVAYLIPIFAIIWGYLLLSENINYTSIIGIILILFGVYVGKKN